MCSEASEKLSMGKFRLQSAYQYMPAPILRVVLVGKPKLVFLLRPEEASKCSEWEGV